MLLNAYSVYDRKTLTYSPPFFQSADGAAARMLQDLVMDTNTNIGRHPNDFVLFNIGQYDDQKGALLPISPLVHVVDAIALVPAETPSLFGGGGAAKLGEMFNGKK